MRGENRLINSDYLIFDLYININIIFIHNRLTIIVINA